MKPLCIYHGGCDDGFAAAWAVRRALGDEVEFYPGVYQKNPPPYEDRDVIFVDFSYKRPVLDVMAKFAKSILILDHHKTAEEDLREFQIPGHLMPCPGIKPWRPKSGIHALFDMNKSGARLAWDYFHPDTLPPLALLYIEDRDLWRKSMPDGDEFTIALRSYPQDFEVWDRLMAGGPEPIIAEGRGIQRYYRLRVEELKRSAYAAELGGVACMISNAPYFAASEVAGELSEGAQFGACYFEVERNRFQYSLRSRGDFDVSEIARKFGGGGHKNAAGFSTVGPAHVLI